MQETIKELVDVIKLASEPSAFDYVFAIAPILLSVVAIIISICTTQKQNKLSLFEKRYRISSILGFLLSVAESVVAEDCSDPKEILRLFKEDYLSIESARGSSDNTDMEIMVFYYKLNFEMIKSSALYRKNEVEDINVFLELFIEYVSQVCVNKDAEHTKKLLKAQFALVEERKSASKLDKYLKIY